MWACTQCHKRMSRKIMICPKCGGAGSYICAECYKPLIDGKHNFCGLHLQEHKEKQKKAVVGAGEAVAGAAAVVVMAIKKVGEEGLKDIVGIVGGILHK